MDLKIIKSYRKSEEKKEVKIYLQKSDFMTALNPLMGCVSNKNTLTSIEGILIETEGNDCCVLSSFDLEKGVRLKTQASVEESGSFIINAVKLNQIIRIMPEEGITIEVDKRNVTKIYSGRSSFELHALNGEDFPNLPDLNTDGGFDVKQGDLKSLIGRTMFAVAQNDQRPALNGAFFSISGNKINVVGCDSNRLAINSKSYEGSSFDGADAVKFIIPGKSLGELAKLLSDEDENVTVKLARKHCVFKIGNINFFTRFIDEEYIDYERFIPKNSKIFVDIDRSELLLGLERAMLVTEDKSMGQSKNSLKCGFENDVLILTSNSVTSRFYDEILVNKTGDNIEIGFNCRYLYDAVKASSSDKLKLSLSTPLMSMIVQGAEETQENSFLYLVLPVKLQ